MELVGEEKKIRALFCELKLEDEHITPRFTRMWIRAQSRTPGPRHAFNLALVAAAVLLGFSLFSLAIWLTQQQRTQQPSVAVAPVPTNSNVGSSQTTKNEEPNRLSTDGKRHRSRPKPRLVGFAARRKTAMLAARRIEIRNAAAISSWQSPTITLLRSPGDEVLSSLPQLNGSANELRSFLPSGNDY